MKCISKFCGVLLAIILALCLSACSDSTDSNAQTNNNGTSAVDLSNNAITAPSAEAVAANKGDYVEIKDKLFVGQINDIYLNADDYLGKTLHYEGIFNSETSDINGVTYYYVARYGPGCCGTDANPGFEVIFDNGSDYPKPDDWVEVTGVLSAYEEDGYNYLCLQLTSLEVKEERGQEYVT
jgi:uncharacterized membrane protein YcgQ (UPF0703/DUF1980 family)